MRNNTIRKIQHQEHIFSLHQKMSEPFENIIQPQSIANNADMGNHHFAGKVSIPHTGENFQGSLY